VAVGGGGNAFAVGNTGGVAPGADANRDDKTDALDITKVERMIAGLD